MGKLTVFEDVVIASGTGFGHTTVANLKLRGPKTVRLTEFKQRQPVGGGITAVTSYLTKGASTATFAAAPDPEKSITIAEGHVPTASDTVSSLVDASAAGHVIRLKNDREYLFLVVNRSAGTAGELHHRIVIETD